MLNFGERVKIRRTQIGLTQQELAELVGYKHKSSIQKIETSQAKASVEQVDTFSKALQTSRSFLVGLTDDPDQKITEYRFEDGSFVREADPDNIQNRKMARLMHYNMSFRALVHEAMDGCTDEELDAAKLMLKGLKTARKKPE